ncbi:hypothetical protein K501DRAFT_202014 [Backusella circina FSU 941]|nr:hypothetical protein K501DRAFT_202014 [Backusella circina FSU 941]
MPIFWQHRTNILHNVIIIVRIIVGIVDTALIHIGTFDDGSCKYTDEEFWGPVYTLYDTLIDLYVTIMITCILVSHIRALVAERMKINNVVYTSVIYNNVIRTVCLTIVNLISAIFIILQNQGIYIMLLWPIINIFFVILVGYDSDVTKAIRDLRQKRWRSLSVMTSTIDLTRLSNNNNNNNNNGNNNGCCHHRNPKNETEEELEEDTDEYLDLDLIHLERWKSTRTGERRFSLPNLNSSSATTIET